MRFFPLLIAAILLQACHIDLSRPHHREPGPGKLIPNDPPPPGGSCQISADCGRGEVCLDRACEPARLRIRPIGVLVAPGRSDGREWDSEQAVPRWVWEELAVVRQRGPNALFDWMEERQRDRGSKPDPDGYGYLAVDGNYDEDWVISLGGERPPQDRFLGIWEQPLGWTDVPFGYGTAVTFDLFDGDGRYEDPIGSVELDYSSLRHALHQRGEVWFDTWEATDGQSLLLGIEVQADW